MLMRFRLFGTRAEAHPVACAGSKRDAELCAAALSLGRTITIADYTNCEAPEIDSIWRDGRRMVSKEHPHRCSSCG